MFEFDLITMYRTADGSTFVTYEDAVRHEVREAKKIIGTENLVVRSLYHEIDFDAIIHNCDKIMYFNARTKKALTFLKECIVSQGLSVEDFPEEPCTCRWDEEYERWTSVRDDLYFLLEKWEDYNHDVKKEILNELIT